MQRLLVNSVNAALLVVIFIGVPAVTRAQLGNLEISSAPTAQNVMLGGLIFAVVINVLGAILFAPGPKAKISCAKWTCIFAGLLFLEYAFIRGWFNFHWLKQFLLWLEKYL